MEILLIGSDYFKPWLTRAGIKVLHLGPGEDSEIKADPNRVDLQALISHMETRPDMLLLTDDLGSRVLPFGLEKVSIPKAYYGVDSPINYYWQRYLAGVFDLVLLDQRDQARDLSAELDREVHWLPVGVDPLLYAGPREGQAYDFAFVGTLEHRVRPKRTAILNLLKEKYSVKLAGGRGEGWVSPQEAGRLYRRSRLVLNENLFSGLTTRMLEVMASGGCLFSEDVDNGLRDVFCPGTHYIAFDHSNIADLAEQYLNDPAARKAVAQKGRRVCRAKHTIQARTSKLLDLCEGLKPDPGRADLSSLGWTFLLLGIRWPGREGRRRIIKAGLLFKEHLGQNPLSARAALGSALALAAVDRSGEALEQLERFEKTDHSGFEMPLIRALLLHQLGRKTEALSWFNRAADAAASPGGVDQNLAPGSYDFHFQWGLMLVRAGHGLWPGFNRLNSPMAFWGGVEHLNRAIQLNPRMGEAVQALARIMDQEGLFSFSHMLWQRALELEPDNQAVRNACTNAARRGYARI